MKSVDETLSLDPVFYFITSSVTYNTCSWESNRDNMCATSLSQVLRTITLSNVKKILAFESGLKVELTII